MSSLTKLFITLAILGNLFSLSFSSEGSAWKKSESGILESEVSCLYSSPIKSSLLLAGGARSIYRSVDSGKNYQRVFEISGGFAKVNCFTVNREGFIYAATDGGLYFSKDEGNHWEKIFYSGNAQERQCRWVLAQNEKIYLGTLNGLLVKGEKESIWKKAGGILGRSPIFFIAEDSAYFYFTSEHEILKTDKNLENLDRVFSLLGREVIMSESDSEGSDSAENFVSQQIYFLTVDKKNSSLYAATSKGIFIGTEEGEEWEKMDSSGLPFDSVTSLIVHDRDEILAGTRQGVFLYHDHKWDQIYKGMETNKINFLVKSMVGKIYAATDKGIFQLAKEANFEMGTTLKSGDIEERFKQEPRIQDVQKMAIEYGETSPEKIKSWRKSASKQAWLPTLSTGINRSASEMYHWDSGPNPDNLLKGKDFLDWDVSLSWNLGELVWNNDQTSIDSRSKLMVELRQDILDQVTRLYFERRRTQIEIFSGESLSNQEQLDKEMRIEELTALLDGFTGGKFSQKIYQNNDKSQNTNNKTNSNEQ